MATIHIDGKDYDVSGAGNLLEACLSLGLDVPYFCWHPALGSVGACRQCAVKVYKDKDDTRGTLVMACMTGVKSDAFISIEDEEAIAFRKTIVEWLMANHPHDCPTCSEGGQCRLQDMVVQAGHGRRRYRFDKRTYVNQDLGPFVAQEMNRCITCYRCVRYYRDVAGGTDFGVFGAHDNVCFGRVTDGPLESEFAGNLTEICPTGVFTDCAYNGRFARKWDLQYTPSICHGCAVGCNIRAGERTGLLRRIENQYNQAINTYFLCDRGRFGQDYVNRNDRPRRSRFDEAARQAVLEGRRVLAIGSARASVETNHALRALAGRDHVSSGIEAGEWKRLHFMLETASKAGFASPSLEEIEACDAVVILGEDLTQTAARMALAVRQAARKREEHCAAKQDIPAWHTRAVADAAQGARYPVFLASPCETKLDDIAAGRFYGTTGQIAQLGMALAHALDPQAPAVAAPDAHWIAQAAVALSEAEHPLIIAGESLASLPVLQAALNTALALRNTGQDAVRLALVPREVNSMGVAMMGGMDLQEALQKCIDGAVETLVVVENDLFQHVPAAMVEAALSKIDTLVVADHQSTPLLERADYVLPVASYAEAGGVVVNYEGRAQRFQAAYAPDFLSPGDQIQSGWRWIQTLYGRKDWARQDAVLADCARTYPCMKALRGLSHHDHGALAGQAVARQSLRGSGRTALRAHLDIREPRQPQDPDSNLAFSMEGARETDTPFARGCAGLRLLPLPGAGEQTSAPVTIKGGKAPATWSVMPLYHLFGSDPTSARSEILRERMPAPYLLLSEQEATAYPEGSSCTLKIDGAVFHLPVRLSATLPRGVVGLPMGIGGLHRWLIGQPVHLEREAVA